MQESEENEEIMQAESGPFQGKSYYTKKQHLTPLAFFHKTGVILHVLVCALTHNRLCVCVRG